MPIGDVRGWGVYDGECTVGDVRCMGGSVRWVMYGGGECTMGSVRWVMYGVWGGVSVHSTVSDSRDFSINCVR
jgi:hypothetical protein